MGLAAGAEAKGSSPEGPLGQGHAAKALGTSNIYLLPLSSPRPIRRCSVQVWSPREARSPGRRAGPRFPVPRMGPGTQGVLSLLRSLLARGQRCWSCTWPGVQPVLPQSVTGERPPKGRLGSGVGDRRRATQGTHPQQRHVGWRPREHEESGVNTGHCVLPPGGWRFTKSSMIRGVSVQGGHGC